MTNGNRKKTEQLGMPHGTATGRLKKNLMFQMMHKLGLNNCYQCGKSIDTSGELSVEHKIPWLDSEDPVGLFFDLDNIAFSHLSCNVAAGTRDNVKRSGLTPAERNKISKTKWRSSMTAEERKEERRKRYLKYGA